MMAVKGFSWIIFRISNYFKNRGFRLGGPYKCILYKGFAKITLKFLVNGKSA